MRTCAVIVLLVVVPLAAVGQAPARAPAELPPAVIPLLKYVPDDAQLVVLIPSFERLAAGLSNFGAAAGLLELAESTAGDMLRVVLADDAVALDPAGAVLVTLSAEYDEPLLIATPAKSNAWKVTTRPIPTTGGVDTYEFAPDRFVVAAADRAVIFARERSGLNRALGSGGRVGKGLTQAVRGRWRDRQLMVYIDVPGWREQTDALCTTLAQRMYMGMSAAGPEAEAGMQVCTWMIERVKQALAEARAQVTALRVDSAGVLLDASLTFEPGGAVAHYLGQIRRPQRDLLRGLPAGRCPLLVAFEWEDAPGTVGLNESLGRAILAMAARDANVSQDKLEVVRHKSSLINRLVPGSSGVLSFGSEDSGLSFWGLYLTSKGEMVRSELRHVCELTPELMQAWGAFPTAKPECQAKTICGVESDVYGFDFQGDASPMMPMMRAIYGEQPMLYMAPHPEGLAYAFGPDDSARASLAALLASDAAPLIQDPRVVKVMAVLSPRPQACALVDIPATVAGLITAAGRLGLPLPKLETDAEQTALAGVAMYLEPQAIRAELYVPSEPVKTLTRFLHKLDGTADEAY